MNTTAHFPLVVIGAGSGGLTAARTAARFGVKVALLERGPIGGDCLHTGCVPSKSLITIARSVATAHTVADIADSNIGAVDFKKVHELVHENIETIQNSTDNQGNLEQAGVTVYHSSFAFQDDHTLVADNGTVISFKKCIIATGSRPFVPPIPGADTVPVLTSENVWELTELPERLAVIGGGPIGLELGQAFAMLGSHVTVFEQSERLLGRFDEFVSQAVADGMSTSGVNVVFNSKIERLEKTPEGLTIHYQDSAGEQNLTASHVLVATGRTPNTDKLNLEAAGVRLAERGAIKVDHSLRTNRKHIYAVGDCAGVPYFTHWAAYQGSAAAVHALFGTGQGPSTAIVPSATFTTPEIAQVGKTEQEIIKAGTTYQKVELPYHDIDRAVAERETGKAVILLDSKDLILGVTIAGHNAGEIIGYFVQLIRNNQPYTAFNGIQAYPTYTFGLAGRAGELAASNAARKKGTRLLLRLRRMA